MTADEYSTAKTNLIIEWNEVHSKLAELKKLIANSFYDKPIRVRAKKAEELLRAKEIYIERKMNELELSFGIQNLEAIEKELGINE